ncbi:DUF3842 family protein [Anoxybacterium hadale]|uniref:DUF3842 family protein n=1 Tax=Anoxybacterium hadale TaxID=3408580 RepID=A0ACD1AHF7_9FIRM|nr:DUF3842 family protein [Clostridiales bacterium]
MKIAVIDGQGGGIGRQIIEALRRELHWNVEILALGTTSLATAAMMKSGAKEGATGENAIVYSSQRVDYILGSVGIITANAMHGEVTPAMAKAISDSYAKKILIPLSSGNIEIVGVDKSIPLPKIIENAARMISTLIYEEEGERRPERRHIV